MNKKRKTIGILIVIICLIIILFSFIKVIKPVNNLNTFLVLGNNDENIEINLLKDEDIKEVNIDYSSSKLTSNDLLKMINEGATSGNGKTLKETIKQSKYIVINIGLNDLLGCIKYDSSKKEINYDNNVVERKLEILKENYYDIVEEIKNINEEARIYLVGSYNIYEEAKEITLFQTINESIKNISEICGCYYLNIN